MTTNNTCTPGTTSCEMYKDDSCYPCPWPRFGAGCQEFWVDINAPHSLVACLLYAFVGVLLFAAFFQRLWYRRKLLIHYPWRVPDKIWLICCVGNILHIIQFLCRPMYGNENFPQRLFPNVFGMSVTLLLIQIILLFVTEWTSVLIKVSKVRGTNQLSNFHFLQMIVSVMLWTISLTATVLEQAFLPKMSDSEDGSQHIPVAVRGGNVMDFRGAYNTKWNALKNINHSSIGLTYTVVGLYTGNKIVKKLKISDNTRIVRTVQKVMRYLYALVFCCALDVAYVLWTSITRLQNEYYFEHPPCDMSSSYLFPAQLIHIVCFIAVFLITKDSTRNDLNRRGSSNDSSSSSGRGVGGDGNSSTRNDKIMLKETVPPTTKMVSSALVDIEIDNAATEIGRKKRSLFA